MKIERRLIEVAVLPLLAGIALGSSFGLGGDSPPRKEVVLQTPPTPVAAPQPKREISGVMAQAWGLLGTDAPLAWKLTRGSRDVVVAVIDTGADVSHPDLVDNVWTNEDEIPGNDIDDDRNGFIDDVNGWNFASDSSDLTDRHGHGTHIAGIVGASGRSALSGVAPNVSLMILKYYDPELSNQNPLGSTVKAIYYAVNNGAKIINYSGGGVNASQLEFEALRYAARHGVLVIAAAGNEKSNSDRHAYFPADYDLPNILSVTAINPSGRILPSSNWGERTVDIAAPGEDILSTLPDGTYGEMTGTSQATAFATGVAVLLKANRPDLSTPEAVIAHLMATGETASQLQGKIRSRAILNSYRALAIYGEDVSASGIIAENESEIDSAAFTLPTGTK
ncbi:MAG: S8 family peptidase [Bdellovibrionota bacterium]